MEIGGSMLSSLSLTGSDGIVRTSGNQTVRGVKTFLVNPISATVPVTDSELVNKLYVDSTISGGGFVTLNTAQSISGDKTFDGTTITTFDGAVVSTNFIDMTGASLSGQLTMLPSSSIFANGVSVSDDELAFIGTLTSNAQTQLDGKVSKTVADTISAIKTFSVLPESSVLPTTNDQLANKKYVDDTIVAGAFVTLANPQTITGDKTISGTTTFTGNITANSVNITPTELGFIGGLTSDAQTQITARVSRTGNITEDIDGQKTFTASNMLAVYGSGTQHIRLGSIVGKSFMDFRSGGTSGAGGYDVRIQSDGGDASFAGGAYTTEAGTNTLDTKTTNTIKSGGVAKITTTTTETTMRNKRNIRISDGTTVNAYVPSTADGNIYDTAQNLYSLFIGNATTYVTPAIYTTTANYYQNGSLYLYATSASSNAIIIECIGATADIYIHSTRKTTIDADSNFTLTMGGNNKILATTTTTTLSNNYILMVASTLISMTIGSTIILLMNSTETTIGNQLKASYLDDKHFLELHSTVGGNLTFIDFHANTTYAVDYDARLIAGGASTNANATAQITAECSSFRLNYLTGATTRSISVNTLGGIVLTTSDARLKENITPIDANSTHLKLLQLEPKNYEWIDKENRGDETEIGLIAQDVIKVIPELVFTTNDNMYGVHYDRIPTLLLQSIKELQRQIDELKTEITELKKPSLEEYGI